MPRWKVTIKANQIIDADTKEEAMELPDIYMPNIEWIEAEELD